jgi:cell division protein FtsB
MEQIARRRSSFRLQHAFWLIVGFGFILWFAIQAILARRELDIIQTEVEKARQEVELLERHKREAILEIRGLQDDPFLIEKRIREETGKARPGEVPFRPETAPKNP